MSRTQHRYPGKIRVVIGNMAPLDEGPDAMVNCSSTATGKSTPTGQAGEPGAKHGRLPSPASDLVPRPSSSLNSKPKGPLLEQIDRDIAAYEEKLEIKRREREAAASPVGSSSIELSPQPIDDLDAYIASPAIVPSGFPDIIWPGICLYDIARMTGISQSGVVRIFNGMRRARIFKLRSIANIYTEGDVIEVVRVIRHRVLSRIKINDQRGVTSKTRELQLKVLATYRRDYPEAFNG